MWSSTEVVAEIPARHSARLPDSTLAIFVHFPIACLVGIDYGDLVFPAKPPPQINQLAALGAEGKEALLAGLGIFDGTFANRAIHGIALISFSSALVLSWQPAWILSPPAWTPISFPACCRFLSRLFRHCCRIRLWLCPCTRRRGSR